MAYRNKTTTPQRLLPTVLPFVVGSAPVYLITWWFGAFASGQTKKGCDFTDCRKVVDNHFLKYEILLLLSFALLVVMVWILRKKLNGKGIVAAFIVLGVVWPVLLTNTSLNMLE